MASRAPRTNPPTNLKSNPFSSVRCDRRNLDNRVCGRLLAEIFQTDQGFVLSHDTRAPKRAHDRLVEAVKAGQPVGHESRVNGDVFPRSVLTTGEVLRVQASSPDLVSRYGPKAIQNAEIYFSVPHFVRGMGPIVVCNCRSEAGSLLSLHLSFIEPAAVQKQFGRSRLELGKVEASSFQADTNFLVEIAQFRHHPPSVTSV